jgi:glycosyltransferase involved in cell wall biosynthesis
MLDRELGKLSNPLIMGLGRYFLGKMVRESDITLVISKVLADALAGGNKEKVKLLPNGVQLKNLLQGCGAAIRKKYHAPIIGFIGSFEYFIDFDLILDAAARLPDSTFLLVGTGREFQRVREQKEKRRLDNVVLTGGVPHDQINEYIDAMDICLNIFKKIPVSHGACPIKLFEYLSMRKPVISTRLEETINIDRGFLFYADTAAELESAVQRIQENRDIVKACAEKGFTTVQTRYDWNMIVSDLLLLLQGEVRTGGQLCDAVNGDCTTA